MMHGATIDLLLRPGNATAKSSSKTRVAARTMRHHEPIRDFTGASLTPMLAGQPTGESIVEEHIWERTENIG
jgi:hypothetical protein